MLLVFLLVGTVPTAAKASNAARQIEENQPTGTAIGAPVALANPVGAVSYALAGRDAASFSIDGTTGQLRIAASLDYEVRRSHEVSVLATDDGGTTTTTVTITVLDVEEPGVISVAPATLRAGTVIRARLNDPDGGVDPTTVIWDWYVLTDGGRWRGVAAGIAGVLPGKLAEAATFIPAGEHAGKQLKVSVKYADRRSSSWYSYDKSAEWVSDGPIAAAPTLPELTVRPVVSGLSIPWDVAFTPDGTMLITERSGKLYSRFPDGRLQRVSADFGDIFTTREVGLMGLAVDPSFSANRRFYTCQGHTGPKVQVVSWTMDASYSAAVRADDPLVDGIPLSWKGSHGGCRIRFGPDGYLWITTGDGVIASTSQDLSSLGGKVLRVDAGTGAGAPDNPFQTRVYTYGHRNPQGLAFRPGTSEVWLVEHGPRDDDEINLLASGGNYGWNPRGPYYDEDVPMTDLAAFPAAIGAKWQSGFPAIATSGAAFLDGDGWGAYNGRLAVAMLKQQYLEVFEIGSDGTVLSEILVPELDEKYGRLRSPVLGPDGALYITTSNGPGKDHVLQVFGPSTPRLSGPDSVSYADGGTVPVATFTPHHLSAPLTWTLAGQDAALFSMSADGVLRFRSPPQFGDPKDADTDNVYHVAVEAEASGGGDTAGLGVAVTVTNSTPELSITAGSGVTEGGSATFTITADPAPASAITVKVGVSESGSFGASGAATVTVSGATTTYTVTTTDDSADEADGSVTATLQDGSGYTVSSSQGAATVSVADNDVPELTITAGSGVTEGGSATFTITADPAPASAITVKVGVSESGSFGATGAATVEVSGATTTYTVTTTDDNVDEADGSVTATLQDGSGYTVSASSGAATVSVADNDVPELSITGGSGITEGGTATFTITASPAPSSPITVKVGVSESGSFGTSGSPVVTLNGGSMTYTVTTTDDDVDEADGSVTATLQDGTGYTVSSTNGSATVSVADNDDAAPTEYTVDPAVVNKVKALAAQTQHGPDHVNR